MSIFEIPQISPLGTLDTETQSRAIYLQYAIICNIKFISLNSVNYPST